MSSHSRRVLLTGASGFIGRHCFEILKQTSYEVCACGYENTEGMYSCNLLDVQNVQRLLQTFRPTYILHLAWCAGEGYAYDKKNIQWLDAGIELIRNFYAYGGERFVGVGTCFEYLLNGSRCFENSTPTRPNTLYGNAKLALGTYLKTFAKGKGLSWAWCRPFYILGPGDPVHKLIPSAVLAFSKGKNFETAAYHRTLDYLDVRDVASALVKILTADFCGYINVSSGKAVVVSDILDKLASFFSSDVHGKQNGEGCSTPCIVGDTTILRNIIKFEHKHDLEETIRWYATMGKYNY